MRSAGLIAAILLLSSPLALSDDTLGTVSSTGIRFEKSKDVSMEYEELSISDDRIRVKFVFKNDSDHDIDTTVVFPVPEIGKPSRLLGFVDDDGKPLPNPLKFELKVDGKTHPFKLKTEFGKLLPSDEEPPLKLKYYWDQRFPKHETVTIEHSYHTGAGSPTQDGNAAKRVYCIDPAFEKAALKLKQSIAENLGQKTDRKFEPYFFEVYGIGDNIEYILKTGANWKGPIKKFKLVLDKGSKNNLISLCWNDLKKTGDTTFVFEKENYTPTKDLKILLIGPRN